MNASYDWLRAFVPFDESPAQLRDLVTARVATVDEIVALREDLRPFVVARVLECARHPESERLSVTKVDAGTGELLDVVCGAPNVQAGKMYPFAPVGTTMPNGMVIEKRRIRGASSHGMLCSARELGLGEEHDGILELDVDVPPGTPFLRVMPAGDTLVVIDVGANRPDLLSHLGLAREIAAATGRPLGMPRFDGDDAPMPEPKRFRRAGNAGGVVLHVEDERLVRRFMGVVIRGVKVGPSPEWLVKRLEAIGSRSINNVVDASNYVLHEMGQPTHAFDLGKFDAGTQLPQRTLVVRSSKPGERVVTLDGVERELPADTIVIADSTRAQAIAGIMGGRDTEVADDTTDILIEVANFDPARVRAARKKLGLSTDASYRFERGVDVGLAPRALERVARLVMSLAGGEVAAAPVDLYAGDRAPDPIVVRVERVERVLGAPVPATECIALLTAIGFAAEVQAGGALQVVPPSWRGDVTAEVDVIEEIARLRGYDSFPDELRPFRAGTVPDDPAWLAARRVRELLVGAGLLEVRPIPFVAGGEGHVRVGNPIAENEAHLRASLLETLARRAEHNLSHMQGDLRLFEVGSAFAPAPGALPVEEVRVAALLMGRRQPPHFTDPKSEEFERWARFDEWDARALAERVARALHEGGGLRPSSGEALWDVVAGERVVGHVSRVQLDAPVWASPAFGFEILVSAVDSSDVAPAGESHHEAAHRPPPRQRAFTPLPTTPAAELDLALLLPAGVTAAAVEDVIRTTAGALLERLALFDEYSGKGMDTGVRSVAWRLTFRSPDRTLRDKEIEGRREKILGALSSQLDVRQRTT